MSSYNSLSNTTVMYSFIPSFNQHLLSYMPNVVHRTEIQKRTPQLLPSLHSMKRDRLSTVCTHIKSVQGAPMEVHKIFREASRRRLTSLKWASVL